MAPFSPLRTAALLGARGTIGSHSRRFKRARGAAKRRLALLLLDVADDVADVLPVLFLLFEEGVVFRLAFFGFLALGLDLAAFGGLLVGVLQRHQFGGLGRRLLHLSRRDYNLGGRGGARAGRHLEYRAALQI